MAKNELKHDRIFKFFEINEIHRVDSPYNKDPKNVNFFQGGPNFGRGTVGNLRKMGNNRDIYCYANRGLVNFRREYQPLPPGIKILVILQFSYIPDQILGKKMKKLNFQTKI